MTHRKEMIFGADGLVTIKEVVQVPKKRSLFRRIFQYIIKLMIRVKRILKY
jgi:hypothetical protein